MLKIKNKTKILSLILITIIVFAFSGIAQAAENDSVEADTKEQIIEYSHRQFNTEDSITLEKFLYNKTRPYYIDVFLTNGGAININDEIEMTTNDKNVVGVVGNGIYPINEGEAQITIKYKSSKRIFNVTVKESKPVDYIVSHDKIVFDSKGKTRLIKIDAVLDDNSLVRCNHVVEWESTDQSVVLVSEDGLAMAEGKGYAQIMGSINGKTKVIDVEVLSSEFNEEALAFLATMVENQEDIDELGIKLSSTERDAIISRCSTMYNTSWTPTQNLTGWRNQYTYYSGTNYSGLPYSQHGHTDKDGTLTSGLTGYYLNGFLYALNNESNFYTTYVRPSDGYVMPMYGNDCSGYLSLAFGINRHTTTGLIAGIGTTFDKVGSYNTSNPDEDDLLDSYPLMQRGDGLVKYGHCFVVGNNYYSSAICYEQTLYNTKLLWHDYDDLADDDYRPFSKK